MKRSKSAEEIAHYSEQCKKLCEARARTFEKDFVGPLRRYGQRRCRRIGYGSIELCLPLTLNGSDPEHGFPCCGSSFIVRLKV